MKKEFKWRAWGKTPALVVLVLFLAACAPRPRGPSVGKEVSQALQAPPPTQKAKPSQPLTVPAEVSSALMPPLSLAPAAGSAKQQERRFDISAKETPAREFFMELVQGTPYNMVVSPRVTGNITLSLKNVTIPEVMKVVQNVYGYRFERTETGFQVSPGGLQSRIFYVNYLNIKRKGRSQMRVSSGQLSESGQQNPYGQNNNNYRNNATVTGGGNREQSAAGSEVDTQSDADFWSDLKTALATIVGNKDGRQVVVQPQASLVIVRAMPDELQEIGRYLHAIQGNLDRQVILEAKIVEVTLNDGFQSGINWAALARLGNGQAVAGQTGGGSFFKNGFSAIAGNAGDLNPLNPSSVNGTATSAFGGVFSLALNFHDFNAFIELLQTEGNVQVLSSPRISTVNNQKAIIKVGSDEFFVTDVSSTTVTGTTTTTTPNITLTPFFSGIALDVTPQIDPKGRVILHIHPTVSDVTDQTKTITVGGQEQSLPLAFSTVRESDSVVSAESGQVVVIGGLMQNKTNKGRAAVPFLGDIPVIGHLFGHTQTSSQKSELVILLRPVVVQDNQTWNQALNADRERVGRLDANLGGGWQGEGAAPVSGQ